MDKVVVNLRADTSDLEAAVEKARHLVQLIEEARALIVELASEEVEIKIGVSTSERD